MVSLELGWSQPVYGFTDNWKPINIEKQSWWTVMDTELITQQSLQCQVFISVFKISYDDIIIKFYFVRQIYFAQTNNEKYL